MSDEVTRAPGSASGPAALVLAAHPAPTAAVTLAMGVLAAAAGRGAGWALAVAGTVLVGQLSIGWSNDALDAQRDRAVGRTAKPAASGAVSPVLLARLALAALVVAAVLSFVVAPWRGALCHVVLLASGWAYNLGLKRTRWSLVPYAVGFGALPGLVAYADGGLPWWMAAAGALLGLAAGLANAADDVDDDLATGVHGAVAMLGAARSRVLSVVVLVAATAVLVAGADVAAALAALLVLAVVAGAVAGLRVRGGRWLFVAVLAIAVVDVALLAAAL